MSKPNIEDIYPLSASQQGMLFHLLFFQHKGQVYFDQYVSTLVGELDRAAWRQAWSRVLERHPALRTQFVWERRDQPLQVVRRDAGLPWQEHDWSPLPEAEREERLAAFLREDHDLGFDLGKPPLTRIAVIRWAEDVHKLVWSFHHLVVDGWSMGLVLADVFVFYRALREGREVPVERPRPFRDYIVWLQGQDPARAESFWRRTLAGFATANPLPFDGTGAGGDGDPTGWVMREEVVEAPPDLAASLRELARQHQLTLNTVFQGAWSLLLSRYAASPDVVFGVVVSGRPPEIEGVESMVGLFINLLPARVDASPESFLIPWLRALQERQLEMREHEHSPLNQVMAWSEVGTRGILFETVLVFENYPVDALRQGASDIGLDVRDAHLSESGNLPLTLFVLPKSDRVKLRLNYHWTRIGAGFAQRILAHLLTLLRSFAALSAGRLEDLPILSAEERRELLAAGRGPARPGRDTSIHRLFEEQAARTPEAPAVETATGERLTYGELAARADALARHLRRLGVGPESVVGLCVERSPDMVVGMLGVLKAGGAYLPLDPAYPQERLAFLLEDSGARLVLTQELLATRLPPSAPRRVVLDMEMARLSPEEGAGGEALPEIDPRHPAYVIYTSGSTGRPKGVLVPHAALASYVRHAGEELAVAPGDRVLQFASMSFDTSAEEIYPCLTRGATLVLRDGDMAGSLERFARDLERLRISLLDLPTAYWHELVAGMAGSDLDLPACVRLVILGGEAVQADRLATWLARIGERIRLVNTYGPTEATIVSTYRDLTRGLPPGDVPIGRAVPNARACVLDHGLEPAPAGVVGELYLGGAGLARGYLGRPDLTAERFVPDPFAPEHGGAAGGRLYRTGDLARLRPDGDLEFRGRADGQVKVRGFRIELGEIEAALRRQPGVRDAVVTAREDSPGERRLVVYLVPAGETTPTAGELRRALQEALPDYMVPAAFVVLAALPLTASGKVDRRALPAPGAARTGVEAGLVDLAAPRNPVEELIAGIWSDLLHVAHRSAIAPHDDFFELGGHSLLAARVLSRVRAILGVELPLRSLFDEPTLAGFAALAERVRQGGADIVSALPPLARVPRGGLLPTSFSQQRLWFLDQLEPGSFAYNLAGAMRLDGALDIPALAGALSEVARRHESLRTTFGEEDGEPRQVIAEPAPLPLPVIDLAGLPAAAREEEARRLAGATARRPYDLARGPLARFALLRLGGQEHALLLGMHHIISDGWSMGIFVRELSALYRTLAGGEPAVLPELPLQYADYAAWQRQWLSGDEMASRLAWWTAQLAGAPEVVDLPLDRPRPPAQSYQGARASLQIGRDPAAGLDAVARRLGVTPFMALLAGLATLLVRYGSQTDVVVGTPIANRGRAELEDLIGFFANTLALRVDLSGDPVFGELARRVREVALGAYAHQDVSFERLVSELKLERNLSHAPVFQVMLALQNLPPSALDLAGLTLAPMDFDAGRTQFDLSLYVVPLRGGGLLALLEYAVALFDAGTADRLLRHFRNLLEGIAAAAPERRLSELPLLAPEEKTELLAAGNRTAAEVPALLLHQLFEATAAARPGAIAVAHQGATVTYAELNDRANRLAHHLRRLGVGPETLVAVCLERSPDLLAALLGVLKAGGAYVPLDPTYPADRIAWVLEDSRAAVLITESDLVDELPDHGARVVVLDRFDGSEESLAGPLPLAGPESLAYVIYTSGSTGRPKGVAVRQRGVVNFLASMARQPGLGPDDILLAVTTIAFDIAVLELFLPLSLGARVELVERETAADGLLLLERLAGSGATVMQATPATWRLLLEAGWAGSPGLKVLCGGEALSPDLARELLARTGELWNVYGPTETTVWSAVHRVAAADADGSRAVPLGEAIANTEIYLLDRVGPGPVPPGAPGELCLGGEGLARGYLGRPDLTAERFAPDPFSGRPGSRLYRTGDLVRRRPEVGSAGPAQATGSAAGAHTKEPSRVRRPLGSLELLGRIDQQVKIRGFRIELGEIEVVLGAHPAVRECAVVVREDVPGTKRLIAHLSFHEGAAADAEALQSLLRAKLPEHMVPQAFAVLPSLPLTPNGKIDRRALLTAPAPERGGERTETVAPRNPVEEVLADVWAEVLRLDRVGVHDNFFALGGDSILVIQAATRSRRRGVRFTPRQLFQNQTVARLAAVADIADLDALAAARALPFVEPAAAAGEAAAPSSFDFSEAGLSQADLDVLLSELSES